MEQAVNGDKKPSGRVVYGSGLNARLGQGMESISCGAGRHNVVVAECESGLSVSLVWDLVL